MAIGLGYALALVGVLIFGSKLQWGGVNMAVTVDKVASLLAPVAFAAAVVERCVEILISPWRDGEANKLEKALALASAGQDQGTIHVASAALDDYRATTQRYAFGVSLVVSVLVSIAGVRALGQFVALAVPPTVLAGAQKGFFESLDVALTALLLSGGADGIHSIVNAVTSFFEASAAKSSKP
jgi:hypothetical protein